MHEIDKCVCMVMKYACRLSSDIFHTEIYVGQVYNQLLSVTSDIKTLVSDKKKKAKLALTAK